MTNDMTNASRGLPRSAFEGAVAVAVLLLVGGDALGERIAMDSQDSGGLREMLFVTRERLLYI